MFNSDYRKKAVKVLEEAFDKYKKVYSDTMLKCDELYNLKKMSLGVLKDSVDLLNSISNKPVEIAQAITVVSVDKRAFESEVYNLKNNKDEKWGEAAMTLGTALGAGIAVAGPSAMIGLATTIGTASTGVAISALSGAAQMNAALAFLGGGATVVGGAGMAGGESLLALLGPVGWAIGGAALIGGGILTSSQNRKVAEKAEAQLVEVRTEKSKLEKVLALIPEEKSLLADKTYDLHKRYYNLRPYENCNYNTLSNDVRLEVATLANMARGLSSRLMKKLGENNNGPRIVRG